MCTTKIGLFGFGVVGQGLYQLLHESQEINAEIKKICIKDPNKKRTIEKGYFTTTPEEIINDPEIDIIVELIDDAEAALQIVKNAFENGKPVVSANKKMIAENLDLLLKWQDKYQLPFLYEASCCAGIPIIRNLEEYYDNDLLKSVEGIFNGSTNYILSQLYHLNESFDHVLLDAQQKGLAESNPSLDIDAIDPKYKLGIIIFHAFGLVIDPPDIFNFGIRKLNQFDIDFARKRGKRIRLLAKCQKEDEKIQAWCAPSLVDEGSILSHTENEFNAVLLEGAFSDRQCLIGKGAGDRPTGSAVLSDISALTYQYRYEYKKRNSIQLNTYLDHSRVHHVYVRYNGSIHPDLKDFDEISEQYIGEDGKYLIGSIKQITLQNANWLDHPDLNILFMN